MIYRTARGDYVDVIEAALALQTTPEDLERLLATGSLKWELVAVPQRLVTLDSLKHILQRRGKLDEITRMDSAIAAQVRENLGTELCEKN